MCDSNNKSCSKMEKNGVPWKGRDPELLRPLRWAIHRAVKEHTPHQHHVAYSCGILLALQMFFMAVQVWIWNKDPAYNEEASAAVSYL